jgi:hypothetical protein
MVARRQRLGDFARTLLGNTICRFGNANAEQIRVIESQKELEELSGQKLDDLHKPFIDDVK